jgi:hypothetical protein
MRGAFLWRSIRSIRLFIELYGLRVWFHFGINFRGLYLKFWVVIHCYLQGFEL